MTSKWSTAATGAQHPLQHGLAFVLSGGLAFVTDAGILKLLTAVFGIHPILARIVSLSFAHVAGWLSHRRFTFRLKTPPTLAEFVRYVGVQSTVALLNYGVFVLILVLRPATEPLVALFASSGIAMCLSYLRIRFAALRHPPMGEPLAGEPVAETKRASVFADLKLRHYLVFLSLALLVPCAPIGWVLSGDWAVPLFVVGVALLLVNVASLLAPDAPESGLQ